MRIEAPTGRLPPSIRPERYRITLTVNPDDTAFSGSVRIDVVLAQSTSSVVLHALELTIRSATIDVGGHTQEARVTDNKEAETISLVSSDPIPAGPATLIIDYSGTLNTQLRGLYEARATINSHEEKFVFTQCEATDARRIFPCFDEPALKARFQLAALVPSRLTALSNMPVESDNLEGTMRRVRFQETPVMSTYLFALAVARFEEKSVIVDGCRLAVVTLPGQLQYADFALEVGVAGLKALNEYFGLRYPLAKLDLVGLPDFAMGAMENWGAIFFRDSRLLVDGRLASTETKRIVANVVVHELVHQWFGNLVTMVWWDDLWLNEAFATWLAVKIVDQYRPEWNSWVEFQQEKEVPLSIDALDATRPIIADVSSAAQIEELFDPLTYEKGAAVLRMIEQFLGERAFRDGIRRYIAAHQHGNATAAALWEALETASGQPVRAIAHDWFAQAGYPLVTVGPLPGGAQSPAAGGGRSVQIEQHRFRISADGDSDHSLWAVPVVLKYHDSAGVHTHRVLLRRRVESVTLTGRGAVDWLYGNAGESGFYRSRVGEPFQETLRTGALPQLEPAERIGLLAHLWALSQLGAVVITEFLAFLLACRNDRTRVVVQALTGYLETLCFQLTEPDHRAGIAGLAREVFSPLWTAYGWDPKAGEDDEVKLARASALWAMGRLAGDPSVVHEAALRFDRMIADPSSIDPTLATPLARLRAASATGEENDGQFQRFVALVERAGTPEARDRYLLALADFPDPRLARRYLDLSLTDLIRGQDCWKSIRYLLAQSAHPSVQAEAWAFMKRNWKPLREKAGSLGATRMIAGLRHVWRVDWQDDVRNFFAAPDNRVAAAERVLAQTLEFIRIGAGFKLQQQPHVTAWLKSRPPTAT
ncbi:MAG TPA: M1 family metallopeptidase [Nitrospiria bacterium]|nr:M1 family metallopeptidase [Nitrospiria bacterium]